MLLAFILSILMILLDTRAVPLLDNFPDWILTNVSTAKEVLSTLAGTLFTVTTFVFTAMLTIISLYTSNFSPRAVENFLLDDISIRTLGLFLGGFVYCLTSLVFMQDLPDDELVISAIWAWLYAIGSVIYFTKFVYQASNFVQVEKLVNQLYEEADDVYSKNIDYFVEQTRINQLPELETTYQYQIKAKTEGYIGNVYFEKLTEISKEYKGACLINVQVGTFISKHQPFATFYTNVSISDAQKFTTLVNETFDFESERSARYDSSYTRNKLNEIALKAISPAINDPNTAIHAIHYKSLLEARFAALEGRYVVFGDHHKGQAESIESKDYIGTVIYQYNDFLKNIHHGYRQLVHYMKEDISCVEAIFEALTLIAHAAHEDKLKDVKEYSRYAYESTIDLFPLPLDRRIIEAKYQEILNISADQRKGY